MQINVNNSWGSESRVSDVVRIKMKLTCKKVAYFPTRQYRREKDKFVLRGISATEVGPRRHIERSVPDRLRLSVRRHDNGWGINIRKYRYFFLAGIFLVFLSARI